MIPVTDSLGLIVGVSVGSILGPTGLSVGSTEGAQFLEDIICYTNNKILCVGVFVVGSIAGLSVGFLVGSLLGAQIRPENHSIKASISKIGKRIRL